MSLCDSLPAITFTARVNASGEIDVDNYNLGGFTFFGMTDAFTQQTPLALIHSVANLDLELLFKRHLSEQTPLNVELQIPVAEQALWVQCALNPAGDSSGTVCLVDISQSHREKEKSKKSAEFFMYMQDQLQDLFYFKDRDSRVLGGNRAFYEYHGETSMDSLIGKSDLDSMRLKDSVKKELFDQEQAMMAKGEVLRSREFNQTLNGDDRYYESIKTPLRDQQGEVVGMVGLTRDITEQVHAETVLAEAKDEAEKAAQAKSAFLAVMSHEIRTPMNGVIGCASLLTDSNLDESQAQLVSTIQKSGDTLLVLINDILDYSKIEAGKIELDASNFELRALIEDCLDLFGKSASEKGLELNCLINPEVPRVLCGDVTRIRQVVCNMLSNAIKFTESGEVFVDVTHTLIDEENSECDLLIEVKDTGVGIPLEHQAKLFNAFVQADSSITRKFGGTGLGLVICQKLIKQMGGDIRVESRPGEGTIFYISMRLKYSLQDVNALELTPLEDLNGLTALIIDDYKTNRMVLEKSCKQWGMIPTSVDSAPAARALLRQGKRYDVVLMDFCMPEINGCDLAKEIKVIAGMEKTPILLLSSINADKEQVHSVDSVLVKPVRNIVLNQTIKQALGAVVHRPKTESSEPAEEKDTPILVAEDNPVNQLVITMMLTKLGYNNVIVAHDGAEAVTCYKEKAFDIVLMDVQMPNMDGFQASRAIRTMSDDPKYPWIIALTAGVSNDDQQKAIDAGMNEFATKPITLLDLKSAFSRIAKRKY